MVAVEPRVARIPLATALRDSGAPYLSALLLSTVVGLFVHYIAPASLTVKGQSLGIVAQYVLFAVAFGLWITYRSGANGGRLLGAFVAIACLQWLTIMVLAHADGALFNLTALIYAPALVMIWWKPPRFPAVQFSTDLVAWSLISVSMASQVLDVAGVVAMRHEFILRWPLMTELFGVTTRWEGPFGNVNFAGPVGAFLLVYGLCRASWNRIAFVLAGTVILIASEARTSFGATAVGIGVVFLCSRRIGPVTIPPWLRIGTVAIGLLALAAILIGPDSDFNARTPVWSAYVQLWQTSPFTGIGNSGIAEGINLGAIPGWASHAHGVYIDSLARYGLIGLATIVSTLIAAGVITTRAALAGAPVGAALLATFIVGGLTETIIDWRYLSTQSLVLVVAVLMSWSWLERATSMSPAGSR